MGQIVRDDEIHVWQCHAGKLLRNVLGRRARLESDDDHIQQHAGIAHADRSVRIGRERNDNRGGKFEHTGKG